MYSISNREYERKAGELAQELEDSGWNAMDSRYTGSKYYIIFAKRGEDGKGIWKAVQYSNQLEPRVIDITYEQGIGREPIDDFDGLRRHLGKMLMPHREGLDGATGKYPYLLVVNDAVVCDDSWCCHSSTLSKSDLWPDDGLVHFEQERVNGQYTPVLTLKGYKPGDVLKLGIRKDFENLYGEGPDGDGLVVDILGKVNGLNEATYPRNFKLGENDIQYVKVYNQYGYTIQEIRIDNVKKTFERGNFSIGHDKAYKNRQVYEDFIEELVEMGYKEIPSDYRCLRNKTRKGVPTEEGWKPNMVDCPVCGDISFDVKSGKCSQCSYKESNSIKEDSLDDEGVSKTRVSTIVKQSPNSKFYIDENRYVLGKNLSDYFDDDTVLKYTSYKNYRGTRVPGSYMIVDRVDEPDTSDVLTEAPVVRLSDDELNNPGEVNFRKIIKRAQDEEDAAKAQAELDAKRAELKAQYGDILDRVADMPVDTGDNFDRLSALFEVLVPAEGKADTVAGECVRATMRLIYRYYNDGDYFFMGYGLETAAPAVSYLAHRYEDMIYDAQSIGERFANSYDNDTLESEYEKFLRDLSEVVIEDILEHPELIGELNEMDSRTTDADWIEDEQPRFETDFMVDLDIIEMLDADIVSRREVQEYVEDCLNWDDVFNGCEVSYQGGDYVYVSELTFDGYNELMDRVRGKGLEIFWEEFVEDHKDELEEHRNPDIDTLIDRFGGHEQCMDRIVSCIEEHPGIRDVDEITDISCPDDQYHYWRSVVEYLYDDVLEELDESLKLTEARAVEDSVWKKFVAGRKPLKEEINGPSLVEQINRFTNFESFENAVRGGLPKDSADALLDKITADNYTNVVDWARGHHFGWDDIDYYVRHNPDILTIILERTSIEEDISDEEDVDKPFTYEQTEAALREITHNFTDESGEVKCFFRQEKDDGRDILKHYYRVVEVSDGRHSESEPMCYVIAYADRDE